MDKISIVIHKLSTKCPPLAWTHVRCLPRHWSVASSKIDFKTTADIDESPFQFIHTMDLSVIETMLHGSPDLVIHTTEIWAVWRPLVRRKKVWHFLMQQFNCCTCAARCAGALSSWNKVITSSMMSLWRREAALKKSVRDITRISCFVTTMKSPHALQIYSTVFVKKCMLLHFFKVVQQQAIGKVRNLIMCLWADNFCLQQLKNY